MDGEWNLVLIDHSRAFAQDKMPFEKEMTRVDRELFARLKTPNEAELMKLVRPWVLGDGAVRAILRRRDKIVAHFERLAGERGEAAVCPFCGKELGGPAHPWESIGAPGGARTHNLELKRLSLYH